MHYICTGECKGVSAKPGTCQTTSCSRFDQPLVPCECTDGKHNEVNSDASDDLHPTGKPEE